MEAQLITPAAQEYLAGLLTNKVAGTAVRLFVLRAGTAQAETCLAYCEPGEEQEGDEKFELARFTLFIEGKTKIYLQDALVDFCEDQLGGQLTIKAPYAKKKLDEEGNPLEVSADIYVQIQEVLDANINPMLGSHGGFARLVELRDNDTTVVLEFGGGCQGCSQVSETVKHGVEKTLKEHFPTLGRVVDVTDHSDVSGAYFQ